jgi:hypothetical protein
VQDSEVQLIGPPILIRSGPERGIGARHGAPAGAV